MKKILMAALALLATGGVALAQTAPVSNPVDPLRADRSGMYVGGSVGSAVERNSRVTIGATGGYQFNQYMRAELAYDNGWVSGGNGQRLMANAIGQYRVPGTTVTPYALAGVGYGFNRFGDLRNNDGVALYNVGGGARIAVAQNVELDGRYRYINSFDYGKSQASNVFTLGVNYRF